MSKMLSKMNLISIVQQLPEDDIETIQGYVEMIEQENQELKKQLEEKIISEMKLKDELEKQRKEYQEDYKDIRIEIKEYKNQQKEFIEYLEKKMNNKPENTFKDGLRWGFQSALSKYKEIIGGKYEGNKNL